MGSRKRRIHKLLFNSNTSFSGTESPIIYPELVDGSAYQVNYSGSGLTEIVFTLKASMDYGLVDSNQETWIDIDQQTCTDTSGAFFFNVVDVVLPYFKVTVEVTGGTVCENLKIYFYSKEST